MNDPTSGYLTKLTDTTGREIIFTYDSYFELQDIKQTRKDDSGASVLVGLVHFGYSNVTINTNFSGVSSELAPNTILPVLSSVATWNSGGYNSLYKFDYTS